MPSVDDVEEALANVIDPELGLDFVAAAIRESLSELLEAAAAQKLTGGKRAPASA